MPLHEIPWFYTIVSLRGRRIPRFGMTLGALLCRSTVGCTPLWVGEGIATAAEAVVTMLLNSHDFPLVSADSRFSNNKVVEALSSFLRPIKRRRM